MKSRTATKTVGSALTALILLGVFSASALAAALVNINTADSATLQTLNGIGPSKAQAIIDYRTQHGPFAKIEDIQNVSGIGPSTYANIKDYITVGDGGSQTQTQPQATAQTETQTQIQPATQTGAMLPPEITAKITTNAQALVGAGTGFDGSAYNSGGEPLLSGVRYIWNFGDGAMSEGRHVLHTYRYPGTYSVELSVAYNFSSTLVRVKLPVVVPNISLVSEGDGSLTIYNEAGSDLDVGLWSLVDGAARPFVIPEGTVIVANQGVRFGAAATGLPGSRDAVLLYPNGTQAASAVVGKLSPLRGERVVASPVAIVKAATVAETSVATDTPLAAAVATAPATSSGAPWLPLGGLVALLTVGGVGAWYANAFHTKVGTSQEPQEFEIEE